jgi:hypothetical protein
MPETQIDPIPAPPAWRTVITVCFLACVMIALAWLLRGSEVGGKMFGDACTGLIFLAAMQAGKSSAQHLGYGGGVGGAIKALLTDAKPGEPPPGQAPKEG